MPANPFAELELPSDEEGEQHEEEVVVVAETKICTAGEKQRGKKLWKALVAEKNKMIAEMAKINPAFLATAEATKTKLSRKLYIPHKEYPNYNFIGLIIGPRGSTQKQMEQDSGCKISIRGKGSVKEGSKGRNAKPQDHETEDLHVYITGDTEENLEEAVKMVSVHLTPMDDELNDHKQAQLKQLALINGTAREDDFCGVCGEKGHRQYECPHRMRTFKAAGVKCAICGDSSHPTRDCPQKEEGPTNENALDDEYNSFLAELEGKPVSAPTAQAKASGGTVSASTPQARSDEVEAPAGQTIIKVTSLLTGSSRPAPINGSVAPSTANAALSSAAPVPASSSSAWTSTNAPQQQMQQQYTAPLPSNAPVYDASQYYGQFQQYSQQQMQYYQYYQQQQPPGVAMFGAAPSTCPMVRPQEPPGPPPPAPN